MNPCIYTKFLTIDEEELERSQDISIPPKEEWTDYSFKIYNIDSYYTAYEGKEEIGTTIEFLNGNKYTVQLSFEELKELEAKYYDFESNQWLTKVN